MRGENSACGLRHGLRVLAVRRAGRQRGEGEGGRGGNEVRRVGEEVGEADLLHLLLLVLHVLPLLAPGDLVHTQAAGLLQASRLTEL